MRVLVYSDSCHAFFSVGQTPGGIYDCIFAMPPISINRVKAFSKSESSVIEAMLHLGRARSGSCLSAICVGDAVY